MPASSRPERQSRPSSRVAGSAPLHLDAILPCGEGLAVRECGVRGSLAGPAAHATCDRHRRDNRGHGRPGGFGTTTPAGGTLASMKKAIKPRRATPKKPDSWQSLTAEVRRFRDQREWSQFHTPKNLAAAIAIEAAELQERFLWKTDKEIERDLEAAPKRQAVVEEIADVLMFAILLADRLDIDIGTAITDKLAANELKYPVALARGNARKYTELRER